MRYQNSTRGLSTSDKILKVNHAGEFGAVNIYKAQLLVARFLGWKNVALLLDFKRDEERHLQLFWDEIIRRKGVKCKSYWLCGVGGWSMGFISALFGYRGVMACTWAVESVVVEHLHRQLDYLTLQNDMAAYNAIAAILDDEKNHRDAGQEQGGNVFYTPMRWLISGFTEVVIRFGMR